MTAIKIARTCSQCGNYGHNARTCSEHVITVGADTHSNGTGTGTGVMLFGVRLTPVENSPSPRSNNTSSFRKCMSMNNMAQYEQQQIQLQQQNNNNNNNNNNNSHESNGDVGGSSGYVSDDALHANGNRNRERKRGVPWTEDEHRLFLMGLSQVGKGDWRGISRNFVKTRSPTQVASHAQKYFLRRTNLNRRRRRSSLFDITTDTMSRSASADQLHNLDTTFQPNQPTLFSPPCPPTSSPISTKQVVFEVVPFSKMAKLNLNQSPNLSPTSSSSSTNSIRDREFQPFLSLKTSQAPSDEEASRPSNFGGFNGNNNGDNIISVA